MRPIRPGHLRDLPLLALVVLVGLAPLPRPAAAEVRGPTYKVNPWVDLPVLATAGAIGAVWPLYTVFGAPAHCAPLCDKEDLPGIDRPAAGNYDTRWRLASDITVGVTLGASIGLLYAVESPWPATQDAVVIAQAALISSALSAVSSAASRRPRPYAYGETAPLDERSSPHAALSFFSGHTAIAFASTTSVFRLLQRRFPGTAWPWIWLAAAGGASTIIGVSRVAAGDHFTTDVIVGAVVGSSMGLIVPWLHEAPSLPVRPVVGAGMAGILIPWS